MFPDGVTRIGEAIFYGSPIKSVTIPDGVTHIDRVAFLCCHNLASITIPDSVVSIGEGILHGTAYHEDKGNWENGVLYVGHCLLEVNQSELPENYVIKAGATVVADNAFFGCDNLANITIPDSVVHIGKCAFYNCSSLTSITIPNGVTSIDAQAFAGCNRLHTFVLENSDCKFGKNVFGRDMPSGLIKYMGELFVHFTDADLQADVLNKKVWDKLSADTQAEIFFTRQGKALMQAYVKCVSDREKLGNAILERLSGKPSAKECNAVANFMLIFSHNITSELLQRMYKTLKPLKSAAKALKMIEGESVLIELLGAEIPSEKALSPIELKMIEYLKRQKISIKTPETNLKEYYGLTVSELPQLKCMDGTVVSPTVMAWLLTTHETSEKSDVVAGYEKPGLCPEAEELVAELDPASLQDCLRQPAANNLGKSRRSKKMFLAYPICRYADETLMAELTKTAPSWRNSGSGNDAPSLYTFRQANAYSNGQERPDMLCIPFRVHLRDIGYVVEDGKPEMGRPYGDEFIRRLTKR